MLLRHGRLWGVNHLNFLPGFYTHLYLAGGALVLLLLIPVLRTGARQIYGFTAGLIFKDRYKFRWAIISATALALFWFFRMPIHLLGDSYSVIENIGNDLPVILKWSEMGAIAAAVGVAQLLPMSGTELGRYAYEIISVISGAITIFFMCGLAYELGKEAVGRLLIFALLIAAGWIVLFLGHTENYPILWPFVSGYIYFGIKYMKGEGRLIWPTLFLLAGLICHMQTIFIAVSYPILLTAGEQSGKAYRKHKRLIMAVGAALVIAAGVILIWIYRNLPELGYLFMPILKGHPASPDYWLLSPVHLLDIMNQYLLLVPLLPLLIIFAWKRWSAIVANKLDLYLLALTAGGFAFVLFIEPKLGMARDWDLFALVGLSPVLFFGRGLANSGPKQSILFPITSIAAVFLIIPFIATNLNSQSAVDNYKYLLNLDLSKSRVGIALLERIYRDQGDSKTADSLHSVLENSYPAVTLMPQAMALYRQARYIEAMAIVRDLAELEPNSNEILNIRGLLNMRLGNHAQAVKDLERAAKGAQYDSRILGNLAIVYQSIGNYDKAINTWRRGQKYDPDSDQIINGLMSAFFDLRQYDSAIVYGTRLIASSPDRPYPYFVLGESAFQLKYYSAAKKNLIKFLEMAPDDPNRTRAENILKRLQ